jgi:exopolysaccharide production protein ExoZ
MNAAMHTQAWLREQFELLRGAGSQNLKTMEGLRGGAVFLVFLVHWSTLALPWLKQDPGLSTLAKVMHATGNVGVDVFFVLSGYLIHGSLMGREQAFTAFMSRRIERIYPAFLATLAAYIALSFIFPAESKIPHDPLKAFVYILANVLLLPGLFPIEPIITVAWSLSYEFFFYIAAPLLTLAFGLRRRSSAWRFRLIAICFIALSLVFFKFGGPDRFLMFISGAGLFEWMRLSPAGPAWPHRLSMPCLLIGLSLPMTADLWPTLQPFKAMFMAVLFAIACKSVLSAKAPVWSNVLCWTPVRWLGNMSYSYYLMHGLALKAIFLLWGKAIAPGPQTGWLALATLPLVFVMTLLPSAMLFMAVERRYSLKH